MGCATLLDERAKGLNAAKILLVPETADPVLGSYSQQSPGRANVAQTYSL